MAVLNPLRRLAVLAIPAVGFVAACAPPDAPQQSTYTDQQNDVDAGGRADTGVVDAEWLETLDGTWLQYTQASNCVDVFGVSYVDQMQRTFYIVQTEQNQLGVLTETFTACDVELAPVLGLQATVPQALLQSTWPVTVTGGLTTGSLRPGAGYTSGPLAELWGLALDDPRGQTLTGGMSFFGGPGNNYSLHGIAEMVAKLRGDAGAFGLVLANGGWMTKEAVGVYSTQRPADFTPVALYAKPAGQVDLCTESCDGTLETFTVTHGKEGPDKGIIFARLTDGRRALANASPAALAVLREDASPVGRSVKITVSGETGTFDFT